MESKLDSSGGRAGTTRQTPKAVVLSPFSGDVSLPRLPKGKPPAKGKPQSPLNGELDPLPPKPRKPSGLGHMPPRMPLQAMQRPPEYDQRLLELEKTLFPVAAPPAPALRLVASGRASPDDELSRSASPDGRLPRLHILESLSALEKGTGRVTPAATPSPRVLHAMRLFPVRLAPLLAPILLLFVIQRMDGAVTTIDQSPPA